MISTMVSEPLKRAHALASENAPSHSSAVDAGGLDSAAFLSLHALALKCDWEPLLPAYDPVAKKSENGPWVFAIPADLQSHLASLDEAELESLASQWATCEELLDDGVSAKEALDVLKGISGLARKKPTNHALLLWLSL